MLIFLFLILYVDIKTLGKKDNMFYLGKMKVCLVAVLLIWVSIQGCKTTEEVVIEPPPPVVEEPSPIETAYSNLMKICNSEIVNGNIDVQKTEEQLKLKIAEMLLFNSGEAVLSENGKYTITSMKECLIKMTNYIIIVEGHCDSKPIISPSILKKYPTNKELSEARANNIKVFLQNEIGINADIQAIGYADSKPIVSNDTYDGRTKNRRIEIKMNYVITQSTN